MSDKSKERRSHPRSRRGFRQPEVISEGGLINHVENISASGVLCRTRRPVPEMTKMRIELELPNPVQRRVSAEGVVVRCDAGDTHGNEFVVAILYTTVADDDLHAIKQYVDHDLAQAEHA